jgi:hypothetical protein
MVKGVRVIAVKTLFLYLKLYTMRTIGRAGFLLTLLIITGNIRAQNKDIKFDKAAFYKAMTSEKVNDVDDQLAQLQTADVPGKEAYEGALTMKKAGIVKGTNKKLGLFKDGHKKLENAIHKDSSNAEFRFLRLMIQEHAPGILGYKKEIEKDSQYIRKSYKTLPQVVQQAVVDYSKKSKALKLEDS